MDPANLPDDKTQQAPPADSPGQTRRPGRPRKHPPAAAARSHGFDLPARPEVGQTEKEDARKFIVLPFRVYHDREMSRQALRVLVMLAAHANRNGFLWCGEQKIADDLGVTQEAVSQQILWLKKAGYIEQTAKHYYGGPTARTATLRIVFDPTMSAEDVLARDSRDEGRLLSNIQETNGAITSSNQKVVDRSKVEVLESTAAALIGEVLERYRGEGLRPPTGHALEREAAMLASLRARQSR